MEIKNYRAVKKGSLDGYLDVYLPELQWTIKGCGLFVNGNKKWVNLPSRQYKDPEGKVCYSDIISMPKEMKERFSEKALEAYKKYTPTEPEPEFFSCA